MGHNLGGTNGDSVCRRDHVRAVAADDLLLSAGVRQVTIVGEAARRVSEAVKAAHPEIPWRDTIARRNVLIHDYGAAAPDLVWLVVAEDLPALLRQLEPVVRPPDQKG